MIIASPRGSNSNRTTVAPAALWCFEAGTRGVACTVGCEDAFAVGGKSALNFIGSFEAETLRKADYLLRIILGRGVAHSGLVLTVFK